MILKVAGLSFRYNGLKILEEVEFRVNRHEILAELISQFPAFSK